jgi:prepilin-type processing-associated H-X9-DG protein
MAHGYGGAAVAASTPSNVSPAAAYESYAPPYRFTPGAPARAVTEPNGWATAAIVFAIIGLIVPVIPGLLAVLFGLIALRRIRENEAGGARAIGGIIIGAMGLAVQGSLIYKYVLPRVDLSAYATYATSVTNTLHSGAANDERCMDNLKRIGQGMRQYAGSNGGHFPDTLESVLQTGRVTAQMLVCPTSGDTPAPGATPAAQIASLRQGRHISYTYVGAPLTLHSSPECVLMYDMPDRHGEGLRVLFVDGRVQTIGDVEAGKALERLNRGVNPPWTTTGR